MLLRPDNVTPASRTPWGGRRIAELKADLGLVLPDTIGEAWELSVEPDFPSRLIDGPQLDDVLRSQPDRWLGREAHLGSTALLVKLLDTAEELSVQIHPEDGDPALNEGESGKPEAWYVVEADAHAGIYLGFREGVERRDVEAAICANADVSALLHFVPAAPGDVFVIEPGTPHAIGRGMMLVEPQRVLPRRRGVTYRYWDWNRAYLPDGSRSDEEGSPRELHLERALGVTRWDGPRQSALVEAIRTRAGDGARKDPARLERLVGADAPLTSAIFEIARLHGTGVVDLESVDALRALTVLSGNVGLEVGGEQTLVSRGQTVALPACLAPISATLDRTHALLCHLA